MPANTLRQSFELTTRTRHTKVDCDITMKVDGRELPNLAVLGEALEMATEMIQTQITKSYEVVPVRDGATPIAEPLEASVGRPTGLPNQPQAPPQTQTVREPEPTQVPEF